MFYNAYHKKLRQLRAMGIIPKSKRTLNKILRMQEPADILINSNFYNINFIKLLNIGCLLGSEKESIDYLRQEDTDFDDSLYHWSNSFLYRRSMLKEELKDVPYILNQWKVLEHCDSYIMVITNE